MNKQYKIHKGHHNLVKIALIEDGKEVGGYIVSKDRIEFFKISLHDIGYKEVEKYWRQKKLTKKEALKNAIKAIVKDIYEDGMHKETLKPISGKYIDMRVNEIIKEVEIRFKLESD